MGGESSEREVSLTSGEAVVSTLKSLGYHVSTIDPNSSIASEIQKLSPDVIFNALHGKIGEDGCIQGLLNCLHTPYTHSGVNASAIAMNKSVTKLIADSLGVRTAPGKIFSKESCLTQKEIDYPYVIKPNDDGSSVDVHIVRSDEDMPESLDESTYLIESYIPGKELSVAVCGDKAIGVIELRTQSNFFDYQAKYTEGKTEHVYPAEIPEPIYKEALNAAEAVHNRLGCIAISRSDFRYNPETNELFFLEINTQPGLTPISLLPEIARHNNVEFPDLVQLLIDNAQCEK